jgi:hypothetical protein
LRQTNALSFTPSTNAALRILDDGGLQTLGILDIDGLHIRVQLFFGTFLVVSLTGNANSQAERNALDTGFPHLLVKLRIQADVLGALAQELASMTAHLQGKVHVEKFRYESSRKSVEERGVHTMAFSAKCLISLIALGAFFLKEAPWT